MPDLTTLRELASQVVAPDLDVLVDVVHRRRTRGVVAGAGGLAAAGLVAAVLVVAPSPRADEPVTPSTPTPTGTTRAPRTADTPSADGHVFDLVGSPLQARSISGTQIEISDDQFATVARYGWARRGANGGGSYNPVLPFDDRHVLMWDHPLRLGHGYTRLRLLGPPGVAPIVLEELAEPVEARPDPGNLAPGGDPLRRVDAVAGTVAFVDVPDWGEPVGWGYDVTEHLWAYEYNACVVHSQQPDLSWHTAQLDCRGAVLQMPYGYEEIPLDFWTADRLAVVEGSLAQAVHVSFDAGLTWERIPLDPPKGNTYSELSKVLRDLM